MPSSHKETGEQRTRSRKSLVETAYGSASLGPVKRKSTEKTRAEQREIERLHKTKQNILPTATASGASASSTTTRKKSKTSSLKQKRESPRKKSTSSTKRKKQQQLPATTNPKQQQGGSVSPKKQLPGMNSSKQLKRLSGSLKIATKDAPDLIEAAGSPAEMVRDMQISNIIDLKSSLKSSSALLQPLPSTHEIRRTSSVNNMMSSPPILGANSGGTDNTGDKVGHLNNAVSLKRGLSDGNVYNQRRKDKKMVTVYGLPAWKKSPPGSPTSQGVDNTLARVLERERETKEERRRRSNASFEKIIEAMDKIETSSFGRAPRKHGLITPEASEAQFFIDTLRGMNTADSERTITGLFRTLKQYRSLLQVTSLISVELDSTDALRKIIEGTYSVVHAERVTLYLVNKHNNTVTMVMSKDDSTVSVPFGKGLAGTVAQTQEVLVIQDAYADERFNPSVDKATGFHTRNMIVVPVLDSWGECTAVLQCINRLGTDSKPMAFRDEDAFILQIVASSAGHCIHKLRITEEALLHQEKTNVLFQVVKAIQDEGDVNQMIERLIAVAYDMLHCDRVTLYLCDTSRREIWCAVISQDTVGFRVPFGVGIAGSVAETGQMINVADAYVDERFIKDVDRRTGYRTRSILAMPIIHNGEVVGVFQLINKFAEAGDLVLPPLEEESNMTLPTVDHSVIENNAAMSQNFTYFNEKDVNLCESFCSEIGSALRRKVLEVRYQKVIADMSVLGRGNATSAQLLKSLLATHTNSLDNSEVRLLGFARTFQALGKFLISLRKIRARGLGDEGSTKKRNTDTSSVQCAQVFLEEHAPISMPEPSSSEGPRMTTLLKSFGTWEFDVLTCEPHELVKLCEVALESSGTLQRFRIPQRNLTSFLFEVKGKYFDNPYHNFHHAAFVFQRVYAVLVNTRTPEYLLFVDVLTLLLSSLCHDIGHSGRTNDFEIKTHSNLAVLYNDASVLEQHHCATTFKIMNNPPSNILVNVSSAMFVQLRKNIIGCIMATDMKTHFDQVKSIKEEFFRHDFMTIRNTPSMRSMLSGYLLHCCDIGAQASPILAATTWGLLVIKEFSEQADDEIRLGLEPTPHLHGLEKLKQHAQVQLGFVDYIVMPAHDALLEIFPLTKPIIEYLKINMERYSSMLMDAETELEDEEEKETVDDERETTRREETQSEGPGQGVVRNRGSIQLSKSRRSTVEADMPSAKDITDALSGVLDVGMSSDKPVNDAMRISFKSRRSSTSSFASHGSRRTLSSYKATPSRSSITTITPLPDTDRKYEIDAMSPLSSDIFRPDEGIQEGGGLESEIGSIGSGEVIASLIAKEISGGRFDAFGGAAVGETNEDHVLNDSSVGDVAKVPIDGDIDETSVAKEEDSIGNVSIGSAKEEQEQDQEQEKEKEKEKAAKSNGDTGGSRNEFVLSQAEADTQNKLIRNVVIDLNGDTAVAQGAANGTIGGGAVSEATGSVVASEAKFRVRNESNGEASVDSNASGFESNGSIFGTRSIGSREVSMRGGDSWSVSGRDGSGSVGMNGVFLRNEPIGGDGSCQTSPTSSGVIFDVLPPSSSGGGSEKKSHGGSIFMPPEDEVGKATRRRKLSSMSAQGPVRGKHMPTFHYQSRSTRNLSVRSRQNSLCEDGLVFDDEEQSGYGSRFIDRSHQLASAATTLGQSLATADDAMVVNDRLLNRLSNVTRKTSAGGQDSSPGGRD